MQSDYRRAFEEYLRTGDKTVMAEFPKPDTGGRIVPDWVADQISDVIERQMQESAEFARALFPPLPPLTRRELLWYRVTSTVWRVRERIAHAIYPFSEGPS